MRSGTTLVQELFTSLPNSYIFHEPWLGRGQFQNPQLMQNDFVDHDIFFKDCLDENVFVFIDKLRRKIPELGVKEIRHNGWLNYFMNIKDIKAVIITRSPREIYISCQKRLDRDTAWTPMYGELSPINLWRELKYDFMALLAMQTAFDSIVIKYEDLVKLPDYTIQRLEDFTNWVIELDGVGKFHEKIERGKHEIAVHDHKITDKSIDSFNGADKEIQAEAMIFEKLMEPYCMVYDYEIV